MVSGKRLTVAVVVCDRGRPLDVVQHERAFRAKSVEETGVHAAPPSSLVVCSGAFPGSVIPSPGLRGTGLLTAAD